MKRLKKYIAVINRYGFLEIWNENEDVSNISIKQQLIPKASYAD